MSQESRTGLTAAEMRRSAFAAPTAALERKELEAAFHQERRERIAGLGDAAALVLDLEKRLQAVEDERRRAVIKTDSANAKLEQMHLSLSTVLGKDTRPMGLVALALSLSDSKFKLTQLAGRIDAALTLDDLVVLKRVVSNMGLTQPRTMSECAAMLGIPARAF